MGAKRFQLQHDTTGEFELDLAPLLAVMVKLVPVLLISSAFVQLMVIETELPQVVQEAIAEDQKNPTAHISLHVQQDQLKIVIQNQEQEQVVNVPKKDGDYDMKALHAQFVEIKKQYPQVFKIDFRPTSEVAYGDLVRMMDEARRAREQNVMFPVKDQKSGQMSQTPYMFPEIVFSNMMGG